MVKVNGPMMSLQASGTLADTITFSSWKGRPYVRERVIPSNPRSGAQVGRRAMFTFLTQTWDTLSAGQQATWQDLADQLVASPFNAFCGRNMRGWHNFLAPSRADPATRILDGSDNGISVAAWEENRVKLTIDGTNLNNAWGHVIFASTVTGYSASVATAASITPDLTIDLHYIYWTPPTVDTWYFRSMRFSTDGKKTSVDAQMAAIPP